MYNRELNQVTLRNTTPIRD